MSHSVIITCMAGHWFPGGLTVKTFTAMSHSVIITCMTGHRFPDGLTVKTFFCHADGTWDYDIPRCDGLYALTSNKLRNTSRCHFMFVTLLVISAVHKFPE